MGQLWDLYVAYRDRQPFPPSQRQVARKLGMSPTALANWETQLSRMPERVNLLRFADLIAVDYTRVVEAALNDAGYLPEREARTRQSELERFKELERLESEEILNAGIASNDKEEARVRHEAAMLGITVTEYGEAFNFSLSFARAELGLADHPRIAARDGRSKGRALRKKLDAIGEENQDAGE